MSRGHRKQQEDDPVAKTWEDDNSDMAGRTPDETRCHHSAAEDSGSCGRMNYAEWECLQEKHTLKKCCLKQHKSDRVCEAQLFQIFQLIVFVFIFPCFFLCFFCFSKRISLFLWTFKITFIFIQFFDCLLIFYKIWKCVFGFCLCFEKICVISILYLFSALKSMKNIRKKKCKNLGKIWNPIVGIISFVGTIFLGL